MFIAYVSTAAIHDRIIANTLPSYSLTKTAGHLLLQKVADGVDQKKLQVVSFHPGSILSETTRNAGLDENSFAWDNGKHLKTLHVNKYHSSQCLASTRFL